MWFQGGKKNAKVGFKKTKNMVFNFTKNYQFATKMPVNSNIIETVDEIKLLGTVITNDLKWEKNTSYLTKKSWKGMQLLYNAAQFTRQRNYLKHIYATFIRPVLEQSALVWCSSLTKENSDDLERIKKNVLSESF